MGTPCSPLPRNGVTIGREITTACSRVQALSRASIGRGDDLRRISRDRFISPKPHLKQAIANHAAIASTHDCASRESTVHVLASAQLHAGTRRAFARICVYVKPYPSLAPTRSRSFVIALRTPNRCSSHHRGMSSVATASSRAVGLRPYRQCLALPRPRSLFANLVCVCFLAQVNWSNISTAMPYNCAYANRRRNRHVCEVRCCDLD